MWASSQRTSAGAIPATRYSSTSCTLSGTRTAMSAGRRPRSIDPNSDANPSASAPRSVALSSRLAAGTERSEAPKLHQLAEQIKVGYARQAIGPDRDPNARGIELRHGRCPGTCPRVASRTGHDRGTPSGQHVELLPGQMHAVHRDHAVVKPPEAIQVGDRSAARRLPVRDPRAPLLEQVAPGSRARAEELELLLGFREVHTAGTQGVPLDRPRDRAKDSRRHRVRRVRRQPDAEPVTRRHPLERLDVVPHQLLRILHVEPEHLLEHQGRHMATDQRCHRVQRIADVPDERGSGLP